MKLGHSFSRDVHAMPSSLQNHSALKIRIRKGGAHECQHWIGKHMMEIKAYYLVSSFIRDLGIRFFLKKNLN